MNRFKSIFVLIFCLIGFISFADDNTTSLSADDLAELVTQEDYEPEGFDSEYVHDELDIEIKKEELLNTLNAHLEIDNIIVTSQLLSAYEGWKGVKYLWGGTTHKGIDCSALTRAIFKEVFGYTLPRVSVDQVKKGKKVSNEDLRPGDIVFFRPNNRYNHVGVYIGNSLFINASSSNGVVISSLNNSYWKKYYKYSVRIEDARQEVV